jgi:hypothetical protein
MVGVQTSEVRENRSMWDHEMLYVDKSLKD